jgi:aminoglycoside 6-adenylyltransferase
VTNDAVIAAIVKWARCHPLIRACIITSTRAIPHATIDALSDYDIILICTDIQPLTGDHAWIDAFGDVLISYWDPIEVDGDYGVERSGSIVQYVDGLKIDFSLWPLGLLERITAGPALPAELDAGFRVLVDKDGIATSLKPPTYHGYRRSRPEEQEFHLLVNDFFVGPPYVAKCLLRNELLPAKWCLDYDMRFVYFLPMLEWRAQCGADWSLSFGVNGKGLRHALQDDLWKAFEATFAGASIDENWDALFAMMELFAGVARDVAASLGYRYPGELERRVTAFVREMRSTHAV